MEKNLLILSLSCNIDCYLKEEKIIRQTWAKEIFSENCKNVDMFFMHSSDHDFIDFDNNIIYTNSPDTYNGTGIKTILSLELIKKYKEYDYFIITNTATVLNLNLICRFINSNLIDKTKFYGGIVIFPVCHVPFFRGDFILLNNEQVNWALNGYKKVGKVNHPNDELIIEYMWNGNDSFFHGEVLENAFMQIKSIDDFTKLEINGIGGNFYVNTKLFERKNNDIIIANIISVYNLMKSDKNEYELENLVHAPNVVRTNIGLFKIEKIN